MATPNMGLVLPAVGVTIGPTWASELNTALEAVDAHDHTGGNGLPITTQAIAIDADLSFDGHGLEDVARVELVSQAAVSALPSTVYVVAGDLYYNNASGVPVQITTGGSIAGATGAISGLVAPASASFDSGTASFRWNANATTRATLDAAALQLRQAGGVSAASITLAAPTGGVTSYTLRLPPTAPVTSSGLLYTSTAGASVWIRPDGATLEVLGSVLQARDLGITTAKLADLSVTTAKLADLSVTTAKLADLSVTTGKLADLSVTTGKLADQGVTTAKLGELSVTTAKLADLSVTTGKLGDLSVTSLKLADESVTTAKIGSAQVTLAKMATDSVDTAQIKYGAVTGGIGLGVTPTGSLAYRTIATENLSELSITTAKIAALAVTNAKIQQGTVNGSTGVTMDKLSPRHDRFTFSGLNTKTGTTYQSIALLTGFAAAAGILRVSLQPLQTGSDSFGVLAPAAAGDSSFVKISITGSDTRTFVYKTRAPSLDDINVTFPASIATLISGGTYSIDISVKTDNGSASVAFSNYEMVVYQG